MTIARSTADMMSALQKHVERFSDNDWNFSSETVSDGLTKIHGSQSCAKGLAISTFNATHASDNIVCPMTGARFVPDANSGFAKNLHLGTTRIWNADGAINEGRWDKFVDFVTSGQISDEKVVVQSKLKAYLAKCYYEDIHEHTTGRNNNAMFSSKIVQGFAATAAWDEVYDRLTCGWVKVDGNSTDLEPYIKLDLVRLFFENSTLAFQAAEDGLLPVKKPAQELEEKAINTLSSG